MRSWFRTRRAVFPVASTYDRIVEQARQVVFFRSLGVADSVDGRFDMLALHMVLVLRRLKGEPVAEFGQQLYDHMFRDMDRSLREIGVSDLSVGRHVRRMGAAFQGRIVAYEQGLAGTAEDLEQALLRNVYRDVSPGADILSRLARYVRDTDAFLLKVPESEFLAGRLRFGVECTDHDTG